MKKINIDRYSRLLVDSPEEDIVIVCPFCHGATFSITGDDLDPGKIRQTPCCKTTYKYENTTKKETHCCPKCGKEMETTEVADIEILGISFCDDGLITEMKGKTKCCGKEIYFNHRG